MYNVWAGIWEQFTSRQWLVQDVVTVVGVCLFAKAITPREPLFLCVLFATLATYLLAFLPSLLEQALLPLSNRFAENVIIFFTCIIDLSLIGKNICSTTCDQLVNTWNVLVTWLASGLIPWKSLHWACVLMSFYKYDKGIKKKKHMDFSIWGNMIWTSMMNLTKKENSNTTVTNS